MKENISIPIEELHRLFWYNPQTGILTHRAKRRGVIVGDEAGCREPSGYRAVVILQRRFRVHRVVYAMYHGEWPSGEIDHINCVKDDNRICNLRVATPSQNSRNTKRRRANTSGFKGVTWDKRKNRWQAQIGINGKTRFLGLFQKIEDAAAAYRRAAFELHGEFANVG